MPPLLQRLTLAHAAGLLLALAGFVVGARIISDNSLLTHLATGDLMVATRGVPDVDPYSRQFVGEEWTVQSWMASMVYSWIVRVAGTPGLRLLNGLLALAVVAGLWRLTVPARELLTRIALVGFVVLLGEAFWSPRPFMFAMVGMVIVLLAIRDLVQPWALLPAMYLWMNSHGSFPLAVVLVGAVAVGTAADRRQLPWRELRLLGWVVAGILLGGLNPIGPRLWWFPIQLLGRGEALERVVEWQPPDFERPAEYVYLLAAFVVVVAARRSLPWADLLPALGFFITGLLAIRNIVPASLVLVAMTAPALAGAAWGGVGDRKGVLARGGSIAGAVGLVVVMATLAVSPGVSLDAYPVEAVDYLDDRDLIAENDVVVVHREGVGNYLTYRYGPQAKVFIDDRFDFYPVTQTKDHLELLFGSDFNDVLDRQQADVVLWQADAQLTHWLDESPDWSLAYIDEDWVVACRLSSPIVDRCN